MLDGAKKVKMSCEGQLLNGRYLVGRLVSRGGMGTVYQGTHTLIGKKVAIKVLNSELAFREDIVTRFYREAQAAAVIGHRNIVDVLDVGLFNEAQPYLVMEYLEGETLMKMLDRERTLNLAAATAVMEPLLLALSASHEKGVVHRDLKPDNVFIGMEGQRDLVVKVIDFGISKFAHTLKDQRLTLAGAAVGTPPYMSPEQARGNTDVDARSDLYSAGIIFYEMLVGKVPFFGVSVREVLSKVVNEPPTSPQALNPDFPEAARPIIERALAKEADARYQSAEEMLADIRALDAYRDGDICLAAAAAGIVCVSCAGVDTSSARHPVFPSSISPDPLSLFATQDSGLPSSMVQTLQRPKRAPNLRRALIAGLGGVVLLLATGFTAARYVGSGSSHSAVGRGAEAGAPAASTPAPGRSGDGADQTVSISVIGVPGEAAVYFNGARVDAHSFHARPEKKARPLRVELAGYNPFEVLVLPDKDMTLDVTLVPKAPHGMSAEGHETVGVGREKSERRGRRGGQAASAEPAATTKGRHGATIADDFE